MQPEANHSLQEQTFLASVQQALASQQFERLILSQYQGEEQDLEKINFRLIDVQNVIMLNGVFKYKTRDVTKNISLEHAFSQIESMLLQCKQANLFLAGEDIQLKKTKKKVILTQSKKTVAEVPVNSMQHDREKQRYLDQSSPYLQDLGICDAQAQIVPSMAKKWKQINKFVEICSHALAQLDVKDRALQVVDFGSGKGYLTFALYDYLQKNLQRSHVTGVELNPKMVQFCQSVAQKQGFEQLQFFQGDVRSYQPEQTDIMIALHACDIATDFAIHTGIRLNASVIMCAPCCHKELRPQLQAPDSLKPMLQFGVHLGQQAEMLTDSIRALLLKAYGYDTKVFEFVALEHTSKNKMILAVKSKQRNTPDPEILEQIERLKQLYAIKTHSLELLLNEQWQAHDLGKKC